MNRSRTSSTLFELLVALALLAGLAALIMPAMLDSLDERAFEAAADITDDQLMLARAHSQSTGAPVEVVFKPNPPRVVARLLPDENDAGSTFASALRAPESPTASAIKVRVDDPSADDGIGESWAHQRLEAGVSITTQPPQGLEGDRPASTIDDADGQPSSAAALDRFDAESAVDGDDAIEDDIRLAVFMPDGSALMSDAVWLSDKRGRLCRLAINPWTGMPAFLRMDGSASTENTAGDRDDEEMDEPASHDDDSEKSAGRRNEPATAREAAADRGLGPAQP